MEFQLKLLRRQKELENGDIIVKLNKENLEIMKGEVIQYNFNPDIFRKINLSKFPYNVFYQCPL